MKIEKMVDIHKDSSSIYDYLKMTRNQDNFSVWNMADPSMNKSYMGDDGTVGFIYRWDSTNKNVGAGEQEIMSLDEGNGIDYELRFFRPMQNTGTSKFRIIRKGDDKSRVIWTFESPSRFPMVLFAPFFKRMLGKDLQKGLYNLKDIMEKNS